jgi:hypothetical protein
MILLPLVRCRVQLVLQLVYAARATVVFLTVLLNKQVQLAALLDWKRRCASLVLQDQAGHLLRSVKGTASEIRLFVRDVLLLLLLLVLLSDNWFKLVHRRTMAILERGSLGFTNFEALAHL